MILGKANLEEDKSHNSPLRYNVRSQRPDHYAFEVSCIPLQLNINSVKSKCWAGSSVGSSIQMGDLDGSQIYIPA